MCKYGGVFVLYEKVVEGYDDRLEKVLYIFINYYMRRVGLGNED